MVGSINDLLTMAENILHPFRRYSVNGERVCLSKSAKAGAIVAENRK